MPHGPEDDARDKIDAMLEAAGWAVQDVDDYDPAVPQDGIAVREYPFESGPADYLLVIDREAVGVIEVKLEGTTLGDGAENTRDTVEREHTRAKRFRQSILKQAFSGLFKGVDPDKQIEMDL